MGPWPDQNKQKIITRGVCSIREVEWSSAPELHLFKFTYLNAITNKCGTQVFWSLFINNWSLHKPVSELVLLALWLGDGVISVLLVDSVGDGVGKNPTCKWDVNSSKELFTCRSPSFNRPTCSHSSVRLLLNYKINTIFMNKDCMHTRKIKIYVFSICIQVLGSNTISQTGNN